MILLAVVAAFYGISMKIADLLNEHGLKLFRGANIFFGVVWGIGGLILVHLNDDIANIILAMILAFIVRMRIDYRNHAIASIIIICYFLSHSELKAGIFYFFLFVFLIFGSIKDFLDDSLKLNNHLKKFFETGWYYIIGSLIYSLYSHRWEGFVVLSSYVLSYNLIKYYYEPKLKKDEV